MLHSHTLTFARCSLLIRAKYSHSMQETMSAALGDQYDLTGTLFFWFSYRADSNSSFLWLCESFLDLDKQLKTMILLTRRGNLMKLSISQISPSGSSSMTFRHKIGLRVIYAKIKRHVPTHVICRYVIQHRMPRIKPGLNQEMLLFTQAINNITLINRLQ